MKKVILSLLTIGGVAAVAIAGTQAFFSDTETSLNNVLVAGDIDLKIDNESWYNGILQPGLSWELRDLTVERFFDFRDLKPGDWEEDTISVHVGSNDAYVCANAQVTMNSDNGFSEPEDEMSGTSTDLNDGTPDGDLAEELNFMFWVDDGDNVFEDDEHTFLTGPASGVLNGGTLAIADSDQNVLGLPVGEGVSAEDTFYIGKAFCYGEFGGLPVAQDGVAGTNSPSVNPGFTCDGAAVTNLSQTDALVGNLSFYAEQVRNNDDFQCTSNLFPTAAPVATIPPTPTPPADE